MITKIPDSEYKERILKVQKELQNRDLDALLVHSTESDFANVFYLSNNWPIFETNGVIIPREGEAILLIGPEAEPYAKRRSKIKKIRKMSEYRESAEPDYPGISLSSFNEIFQEITYGKGIRKLGLGDYTILPLPVFNSVKKALGSNGEIVRADDIIPNLRAIKSENEIAMIKKAHEITETTFDEILGKIKPGLTEKQIVGMVVESFYRNGAECEAYPQYIFGGRKTRDAISRTTYRKIRKNEIIQIGIGARYGGYSSSIGRPIMIGKMSPEIRKFVQFGLEAHLKTYEWIKEGVLASEVAIKFIDYFKSKGMGKYYLYGPCHGTGIIEVERPWLETNSNYYLKENMTFMADTFLTTPNYGIRWEDGFLVTKTGVNTFSNKWQTIIEL